MIDEDDLFDTPELPSDGDIDDEMRGLLDHLDETDDEFVTARMDSPAVEGNPSPPLVLAPGADASKADSRPPLAEELTATDIRRPTMIKPVATETSTLTVVEPPIVDLKRQFEQFDQIAEEVWQGTRADRQETQDGINICRSEIDKAITGGGQPARMWVDNLGKMLEVKATINMTAIKALEAKAKLLAATKAGVNIQNNLQNNNANIDARSDQSLVDLLNSSPLKSEGEDEF